MTKTMHAHIAFAKFAALHKIDPTDLAHLITYAKRAFKAGERECNEGVSADKHREMFEAKAAALGFGTEWNGLGPTLKKDGQDIYLPAF